MDESKGPSCRFRVSTLVACSRLATRYNGNHGIAQAAHHRSGSLVQSHNADTIVPLAYQAQQSDRPCSTSYKCRRFVDYVSPWKRGSQAECSSRMTLRAYVLHDRQQVGRGLSWILGNVSYWRPSAAVEGCLLLRRCWGISRHASRSGSRIDA